MKQRSLFFIALPLYTIGSLALMTPARGQIVPDNTLGAESSVVTTGINSDRISDGATRGANLFHSFEQFNIGAGRRADFAPASNIVNILTRVTGSNPSNIQGVLGVLGNANLFFINPNGIIFGENARLALNGSFLASTASSFKFPDGSIFSAINPTTAPLLAVNIPNGLQFRNNPTSIRVESGVFNNQNTGLNVTSGKSLALVGGEVLLNGGVLRAPNGRVELGGLAATGEVKLDVSGNNLRLSFPQGVERSNVSLRNVSAVSVNNRGEGSIGINAKNLEVSGSSRIESGIQTGTVNNTQKGNVEIDAKESVNISSGSFIRNNNGGTGSTGDIIINTDKLSVSGSQIEASVLSAGNGSAGKVEIVAKEVSLAGTQQLTGIFNNIAGNRNSRGRGSVGGITINTNSLSLTNLAEIAASTFKEGNAGIVTITAKDTITLDTTSGIFSNVEPSGNGNAGSISVTTNNLELKNGAQIASNIYSNRNPGSNGGSITINATGNVSIDGEGTFGTEVVKSAVFSSVEYGAVGRGGDVNITARALSLTNGARISTTNLEQGNAGNITLSTKELSLSNGAQILTTNSGQGNAGNITLSTKELSLSNGAQILTTNSGIGNAGNITLSTKELFLSNGAQILTTNSGIGNAGDVSLTAENKIALDNDSAISSSVGAPFSRIRISENPQPFVDTSTSSSDTSDNIQPRQPSFFIIEPATSPYARGNSGKIDIRTSLLSVSNNSRISVGNLAKGDAGKLNIHASEIKLNNGQITGIASSGRDGNIELNASDLLLLRRSSQIIAYSDATENNGNISINTKLLAAFPFENSDIAAANSTRSSGGNVDVKAEGILGIEYQPQLRPGRSDIVATGTVSLSLPNFELDTEVTELPDTIIDWSQQIAPNPCQQGGRSGKFAITGRGGLPPNPNQFTRNDNVRVALIQPVASTSNSSVGISHKTSPPNSPIVKRRVPAQGWIFNEKGEVQLTAYDPTDSGSQRSLRSPTTCTVR